MGALRGPAPSLGLFNTFVNDTASTLRNTSFTDKRNALHEFKCAQNSTYSASADLIGLLLCEPSAPGQNAAVNLGSGNEHRTPLMEPADRATYDAETLTRLLKELSFNDMFKEGEYLNTVHTSVSIPIEPLHMGCVRPNKPRQAPVPNDRVTVRFRIVRHDHHPFAYLLVKIILRWLSEGEKLESRVDLRVPARSCRNLHLQQYIRGHPPFAGLSDTELPPDVTVQHLEFDYAPRHRVSATNLLGASDFGPWSDTIAALRRYAVHGGHFHFAFPSNSLLATGIDLIQQDWAAETTCSPLYNFWTLPKNSNPPRTLTAKHIRPRAEAPCFVLPATVSFESSLHFATYEAVGLQREREWCEADIDRVRSVQARFLRLPGAENVNCLLMLIDETDKDNLLNLYDGNAVTVDIKELNADWDGKVGPDLSVLPPNFRLLHLKRPWDDDEKCWDGLDPATLVGVPNFDDLPDKVSNIHPFLAGLPIFAVQICPLRDYTSLNRRAQVVTAALKYMAFERDQDPNHVSCVEDVLLADRFDRLTTLDLFADFEPSLRTATDAAFDPTFQIALNSMPGGFALMQACAGAGKSRNIAEICGAFARHFETKAIPRSHRDGVRALITTSTNVSVEALCQTIRARIGEDAIVLRVYNHNTVRALFMRKEPTAKQTIVPTAVQQLFSLFHSRHERVFPLDPRVTAQGLEHSDVEYVALALKFPYGDHKIPSDPRKRAIHRVRMAIGDQTASALKRSLHCYLGDPHGINSKEDLAGTCELLDQSIRALYSVCDAVVTTVQQSLAPTLFNRFEPRFFVLDEATNVTSAESLAWAQYPRCRYRLFFGDAHQAVAQLQAPLRYNGFRLQNDMSLFIRLHLAGFPTASSDIQYRYGPEIAALLAHGFYGHQIHCSPSNINDPGHAMFAQAASRIFGLTKNVILVDVGASKAQPRTRNNSLVNDTTTTAVWAIINALHNDTTHYTPEDVGIITPYIAQHLEHEVRASQADQNYRTLGSSSYLVGTIERAQSLQRKLILFDIPNTDGLGFVATRRRVCTALSRAQFGLIIVADVRTLKSVRGFAGTGLSKVFEWCKSNQCYVTWP